MNGRSRALQELQKSLTESKKVTNAVGQELSLHMKHLSESPMGSPMTPSLSIGSGTYQRAGVTAGSKKTKHRRGSTNSVPPLKQSWRRPVSLPTHDQHTSANERDSVNGSARLPALPTLPVGEAQAHFGLSVARAHGLKPEDRADSTRLNGRRASKDYDLDSQQLLQQPSSAPDSTRMLSSALAPSHTSVHGHAHGTRSELPGFENRDRELDKRCSSWQHKQRRPNVANRRSTAGATNKAALGEPSEGHLTRHRQRPERRARTSANPQGRTTSATWEPVHRRFAQSTRALHRDPFRWIR